ncbi:UDP-N-acetylmuramoyl-tripeptide--D-alanyl-D-alanine ligase [Sphingomicrobium marinum]|uniref:UDP-N-acetylmuramoyl-tripeptide--D-alanyl-D- alanine ligase n=1 Tax=Sphingomicrobium marinum TaxID=1227950 RepID=UPI002240DC4C|nr:UDP-N-acetylmuramoyl-tripeptide--D-alanyl-D-alanine ligase [Sphingomicrobium marinum]
MTLWTAAEIAQATGGTVHGDFVVDGATFDSREVEPGDLFIAMPGTAHDGHDFVAGAFEKGAHGALVSKTVDGPHVLVVDVTTALDALASAARDRLSDDAVVIGVTGSVGKTSTKEALYAALDRSSRGKAHRSVKSYNNHTGVPLSLVRCPRDVKFAVFEMGMNHSGEIAALTRLARPHIALITAIAPAHIENLGSMEAIADAKAEIFEGLVGDGVAIIPEDTPYSDQLIKKAKRHARTIMTFGSGEADVAPLNQAPASGGGTLITARLRGGRLTYTMRQPGDHWVTNSLAVLAAVEAAGGDVAVAGLALAELGGLKGRGARHRIKVGEGEALLIDESYNANSASMAATLKSLASEQGRKVAILGTMKELGEQSARLHAELAAHVIAAGVEKAILVGAETAPLFAALDGQITVHHVENTDAAIGLTETVIRPGDAILVKASNSMGLGKLVDKLAGGSA